MARLAVSDTKKKTSAVKGVITQYMDRRNANEEYMAEKLGIAKKTFRSKMENPGRFSVVQLAMVANILQIPQKVNFFIGAEPQEENVDEIAKAIVLAVQRLDGTRK